MARCAIGKMFAQCNRHVFGHEFKFATLRISRVYHEFDLQNIARQFGINAGACGGVTCGNPRIPDLIQACKVVHIRKPNRDPQHLFA